MLDAGNGNHMEVFAGGAARPARGPANPSRCCCTSRSARRRATRPSRGRSPAGAAVVAEPKTVTIPSDPPTTVRIAFCTGPDGETIEFFQDGA